MKNTRFVLFSFTIILMAFSFKVNAQDVTTNQDIIAMKVSKISDDIILTKITSSQCTFDLSTSGLIDLKNAKLSDKVIKQMLISSPPSETITNEDVIKMYQAKISNSIIKDKMMVSDHNYDVSSDGLIALTTAKIPKDIVKYMIENPQGSGSIESLQNVEKKSFFERKSSSTDNNSNRNTNNSKTTPVEYTYNNIIVKNCPTPEFSSRPYYLFDNTLKSLERTDMNIDVKVKAFGYGGSEVFYTVFPTQSTCRFEVGQIPPLIVMVDNNIDPSEMFYLLKAKEVNKDRRRFIVSKMSLGGKSADLSEYIIPVKFEKIKDNIYQILVPDNLQPGEYGFMPTNLTQETKSAKINCFGID